MEIQAELQSVRARYNSCADHGRRSKHSHRNGAQAAPRMRACYLSACASAAVRSALVGATTAQGSPR